MKIAGVWIATFGYTMIYLGLNTLAGNTISFTGALLGKTPTPATQSANATGGNAGILGTLLNITNPLAGAFINGATSVQRAPAATPTTASPNTGASSLVVNV